MAHRLGAATEHTRASRSARSSSRLALSEGRQSTEISRGQQGIDKFESKTAWARRISSESTFSRLHLAYSAYSTPVESRLQDTLIEVWRQTLVEDATVVELGKEHYAVRRTPKHKLRQVDFVFDGTEIRGLEQNPQTRSQWAQLARSGKKVMQFLSKGRYVAVVVDGKATLYGRLSDDAD